METTEAPEQPYQHYYLEQRWYDPQWKRWTEWEEVTGRKLKQKYGDTPDEWKAACREWIDIGGLYEYRIGVRTGPVWTISYRNPSAVQTLDDALSEELSDVVAKARALQTGSDEQLRLLFGELNAREIRTLRAVLDYLLLTPVDHD